MTIIGIIGGLGWMARAMLTPTLEKGLLSEGQIIISSRRSEGVFKGYPAIKVTDNNKLLVETADVVVLAVKPDQLSTLNIDLSNKLVISILAGVSMDQIQTCTQATRVVRAMPNAAAELGESLTGYCIAKECSTSDALVAESFLQGSGKIARLNTEEDLNAFTAFIGSGHGWLAYFANSITQSMRQYGFDDDFSDSAVRQLFRGVGMLLEEEEETAASTVSKMTHYGGTTAAGLIAMDSKQLSHTIHHCLMASVLKANSDMTTQGADNASQ